MCYRSYQIFSSEKYLSAENGLCSENEPKLSLGANVVVSAAVARVVDAVAAVVVGNEVADVVEATAVEKFWSQLLGARFSSGGKFGDFKNKSIILISTED